MDVVGRLFGLVSAALVSIFLISSFSIGVVALQDTNNDGKINIIDMVMSLNRNLVRGDTNNDAKVDIFDLAAVGLAFGSKKGDPNWNNDADVANTVDEIDIFDLATVGKNFNIQNADSPVLDPPISVVPSSQQVSPGDSFNVNITIDSPVGVYAFDIIFFFNPGIVNATGAIEGGFLKKDGASTFPVISIDNTQGKISIASTRFGVATEVTGTGNLATISFTALATGTSNLDLASATLVNSNLQTIAGVTTNNGTVTVGAGCTTHDHFACFDDDVYWYDSCNVKEEKKGECSVDSCGAWGANYCKSGNVYRSRTCNDRGCSNNACFDNTGTDEQLVQTCQYGCSNEQCIIPQCFKNSDCGTDGWVDSPTCSSDDVYQTYRTYTCSNPGTADASCSHADAPALKQDCGEDSCGEWDSNYCKNGDVYHSKICHDLGCALGSCFDNTNTEEELVETCQYGCSDGECIVPSCMQNSDCGTDGLVGGLFCSNDDVFQAYRTYTCNNPGTANSFCSHADVPIFKEDCGIDSCDAWGGNYCKDGDVYHSRTCYDKGCAASACFSNPWNDEQLVQTCPHSCAAGTCVNTPPVAEAGGPYTGNEGSAIRLDGSNSSDPDGDPLTYQWDLDGDGQYDDATGVNPFHTWNDDFNGIISLNVTDNGGLSGTDNASVSVSNVNPGAAASNKGPVNEGSPATVTATATDAGADTFTYSFDWNNDGTYEITDQAANSAQNTWNDNGNYVVGVRVKDDDGGVGTAATTVVVNNVPPTANAGPDLVGVQGVNVAFIGSATDPGSDTFTYSWNFGDGASGTGQTINHAYQYGDRYTATLTVTDDDGGVGTDTAIVDIDAVVNIPNGTSIFSLPLIPAGGSITFNQLNSDCIPVLDGPNYIAYIDSDASDPLSNNYIWRYLGLNDPLYPGQGYFIKVNGACSFNISGTRVLPGNIGYLGTGNVKPGWNTIGAPTIPANFSAVKGTCNSPIRIINGSVVGGPLLFTYGTTCVGVTGYNGGYEQCGSWYCYCETSTMQPGKGYLLVSNWLRDCQLG